MSNPSISVIISLGWDLTCNFWGNTVVIDYLRTRYLKKTNLFLFMRTTIIIAYWILSVLIAALTVMLFTENIPFVRALFMGIMFLPGALAAQYMLPKISFRKRSEGIRNTIYVVLAIMILEYLLLIISYSFQPSGTYVYIHGKNYANPLMFPNDTGVMNPLFITIMVSLLALGGAMLDRWLGKNHPEMESPITFCSDRKRVSIFPSDIVYVESCDTEVFIHTTDGRRLRNKTGISQWESALGYPFVRIHRAFLVNSNHVESFNQDTVKVGEEELPVSRKYQKALKDLFPIASDSGSADNVEDPRNCVDQEAPQE